MIIDFIGIVSNVVKYVYGLLTNCQIFQLFFYKFSNDLCIIHSVVYIHVPIVCIINVKYTNFCIHGLGVVRCTRFKNVSSLLLYNNTLFGLLIFFGYCSRQNLNKMSQCHFCVWAFFWFSINFRKYHRFIIHRN